MLKKFGDLNPIRIVNTTDIDISSTNKKLKKAIKDIKKLEKKEEEK